MRSASIQDVKKVLWRADLRLTLRYAHRVALAIR
jgi:hypothetical protein